MSMSPWKAGAECGTMWSHVSCDCVVSGAQILQISYNTNMLNYIPEP